MTGTNKEGIQVSQHHHQIWALCRLSRKMFKIVLKMALTYLSPKLPHRFRTGRGLDDLVRTMILGCVVDELKWFRFLSRRSEARVKEIRIQNIEVARRSPRRRQKPKEHLKLDQWESAHLVSEEALWKFPVSSFRVRRFCVGQETISVIVELVANLPLFNISQDDTVRMTVEDKLVLNKLVTTEAGVRELKTN